MFTLCEWGLRPPEHVGQKGPLLTHDQEVMHDSEPATKQLFLAKFKWFTSWTVTYGQDFGAVTVHFLGLC